MEYSSSTVEDTDISEHAGLGRPTVVLVSRSIASFDEKQVSSLQPSSLNDLAFDRDIAEAFPEEIFSTLTLFVTSVTSDRNDDRLCWRGLLQL
jgi:hypothetical protein